MQIVINIPESEYNRIMASNAVEYYELKIAQGTVLPKGHGRLIDADKYKAHIFSVFPCNDTDDSNIRRATELGLDSTPTVISEDKEG